MKYIVTGGAGFIGSHIVERLVKEKKEVTVIDNLSTGRKENIHDFLSKLTFIQGDLLDKKLAAAKVFGATDTINVTKQKAPERVVRKLTAGRGATRLPAFHRRYPSRGCHLVVPPHRFQTSRCRIQFALLYCWLLEHQLLDCAASL